MNPKHQPLMHILVLYVGHILYSEFYVLKPFMYNGM